MAYESYPKTKPICKPIAVGGAKAQEYIGGEQPSKLCEERK